MNKLNERVVYYPHLFLVEEKDDNINFKSFLFPIKCVDDLSCLGTLRARAKCTNSVILSSIMTEGTANIINSMLQLEPRLKSDKEVYRILVKEFGVLTV